MALRALWSPWPQYANMPRGLQDFKDSRIVVTVIIALEFVERIVSTLAALGVACPSRVCVPVSYGVYYS